MCKLQKGFLVFFLAILCTVNSSVAGDVPIGLYYGVKPVNQYVFRSSTILSDNPGNCLYTLKTLIAEGGGKLSYGAEILMPVSSRVAYGGEATKIDELVQQQKYTVKKYAQEIAQKTSNAEKIKKKAVLAFMSNLVNNSSFGKSLLKKTVDSERCVRCGMCAKICPTSNITMTKNGPEFGDRCTDCLACVHWCPRAAIGFRGKNIRKNQQYHHPDVDVHEMMQGKNHS